MYTDIDRINQLDTEPNAAMEELVEQYTALVWHIAAKYLLNTEDIKECVNDTFAEVYEHRKDYDENKGSLAVWIGTIAKHRAISMYRKLQKVETQNMEDYADTSDHISKAEDAIDIEEAVKKLSDTDRQMIRMKYYEGMSIREIAESLNIPYETAKKRHTRSVKNLKRLLMITLVIIAVLALVACGFIYLYRHQRVLPGYGITMGEDPLSFALPEKIVVQQDIFTVEVQKVAIFNDTVRCMLTISVPEVETHAPGPGEEGFVPNTPGPGLQAFVGIRSIEGRDIRFMRAERCWNPDNTDSLYFQEYEDRMILSEEDVERFREEDSLDVKLFLAAIYFDAVEYDEIEIPLTLTKVSPEEIAAYPYTYDKENGGMMVDASLDGDELSLDVYPLAGEKYEFYAGLTSDPYWKEENVAPVRIFDEAGNPYDAHPQQLTPIPLLQESSVTYTFEGISPGRYTLSIPYVYLVTMEDNDERIAMNLEDCTFEDKTIHVPGGTLRMTQIQEKEPEEIYVKHGDKHWEICMHYEPDEEDIKLTVLPYLLTPEKTASKDDMLLIMDTYWSVLDAETNDFVWNSGWESQFEEIQDYSYMEFRPILRYDFYYSLRYDHQIEVSFEVTE